MSVRHVAALLAAALLAACASKPSDEPSVESLVPHPAAVEMSDLPPLSGHSSVDGWRSYASSSAPRQGRWKGKTAWRFPPKERAQGVLTRPYAAAVETDYGWADRWVRPEDRDSFDQALRSSVAGLEGRWRSSDGSYGVALPAQPRGCCQVIEVMLTETEGGLPIRSRGTITECGWNGR